MWLKKTIIYHSSIVLVRSSQVVSVAIAEKLIAVCFPLFEKQPEILVASFADSLLISFARFKPIYMAIGLKAGLCRLSEKMCNATCDILLKISTT